MKKTMTTLLINGQHCPFDLPFEVHPDEVFKGKKRNNPVTQIVLHESVTHDPDVADDSGKDDATERVLNRRGLGVHIMVGVAEDNVSAEVTQHNDLVDKLAHAGGLNSRSIGIEVINPYYPPARSPWTTVIDAPWAHKRKYVVPLLGQCEAVYQICHALTGACLGSGQVKIARRVVGVRNNSVVMGRLTQRSLSTSGIWAHGYDHHADGFFPALFVALRLHGLGAHDAYTTAVSLATGARGSITLPPQ